MKLSSSSNLAFATLAFSPSLLSSPVFGAPTPDVGGEISPNPNAGFFADPALPQAADLPLSHLTSTLSATSMFVAGPISPTTKASGRRRSIKRHNSVRFRAVPSAVPSAEPEVVSAPSLVSHPTTVTSSFYPSSTPVLISPDGSIHVGLSPIVRAMENGPTVKTNERRLPQHDGQGLKSSFLNSPVPHDIPTFSPLVAISKRDMIFSNPPNSYVPVSDAPSLPQGGNSASGATTGLLRSSGATQGLGLYDIPFGNNPQQSDHELSDIPGTVDPSVDSVESFISNPNELNSLVDGAPAVSSPIEDTIRGHFEKSPVVESGAETAGSVLNVPALGGSSFLPVDSPPNAPSAGVPSTSGVDISGISSDDSSGIPSSGLPGVPVSSTPIIPIAGPPIAPGVNTASTPVSTSVPSETADPSKPLSGIMPSSTSTLFRAGRGTFHIPEIGLLPPLSIVSPLASVAKAGVLPIPIHHAHSNRSLAPAPSSVASILPTNVDDSIVYATTSITPGVPGAVPTNGLGAKSSRGSIVSTSMLSIPTALPAGGPPIGIMSSGYRGSGKGTTEVDRRAGSGGMGEMARPKDEVPAKDFGDWEISGDANDQSDSEGTSKVPSSTLKSIQPPRTTSVAHSEADHSPDSTLMSSKLGTNTAHPTQVTTTSVDLERHSAILVEMTPTSVGVPPAHASLPQMSVETIAIVSPASSASSSSDEEAAASVTSSLPATATYLRGTSIPLAAESTGTPDYPDSKSLRWRVGSARMTTSILKPAATGAPGDGQMN